MGVCLVGATMKRAASAAEVAPVRYLEAGDEGYVSAQDLTTEKETAEIKAPMAALCLCVTVTPCGGLGMCGHYGAIYHKADEEPKKKESAVMVSAAVSSDDKG